MVRSIVADAPPLLWLIAILAAVTFISGAPYVIVMLLHRPATEYGFYFMLVAGGFMLCLRR